MNAAQRTLLFDGAAAMGIALDDDALKNFAIYLEMLQEWGRKINLTTRLGTEEIVLYHFLDSLAGAPVIAPTPDSRIVDLGAGAGFPGFPLKFAIPGLRLTLLESVRKKVSFCQAIIRTTRITNTIAEWRRGEEAGVDPRHERLYDWVVSRALGTAADVAQLAYPFLATGGRILLYKGEPAAAELHDLDSFCAKHQATWSKVAVTVPHIDAARSFITIAFQQP